MSTTEKQESQKTVVAFVAGLLIGGLLVWVFSSSPEDEKDVNKDTARENADLVTDAEEGTEAPSAPRESAAPAPKADVVVPSDATVSVADQAAGDTVTLTKTTFPLASGWVVVREENGTSILGAARFETNVGLVPTTVELMRATVSGETYEVVFYTDNGDKAFDTAVDLEIEGVSTTFKAN